MECHIDSCIRTFNIKQNDAIINPMQLCSLEHQRNLIHQDWKLVMITQFDVGKVIPIMVSLSIYTSSSI